MDSEIGIACNGLVQYNKVVGAELYLDKRMIAYALSIWLITDICCNVPI